MNNIRNYRINLENFPLIFNNIGNGIALFDLLGTFFIAYIIEQYINLDSTKRQLYYLSLIPFGIIIHYIIGQNTFLNTKLTSPFNELNIYKIILFICIFFILSSVKR